MADPFISTKDLVDILGRGGTADPGMLIATDAACDIVRDVAEQTFNKVFADVLTLDGSGTDVLVLPERPVSGAGTVVVNGGTVTDYVLDKRRDLLVRRSTDLTALTSTTLVWPAGRQNVTVTYDHGFADADIPRSVRMVALALASRIVVQGPAKTESIGAVSVTYAASAMDLTENERRILGKYHR